MIVRCENPNSHRYDRYGGRGIKVCRRWRESFEAFYEDMGQRPSKGHSLDRFPNNDGDYERGNCRWATRSEQNRNTNHSLILEHDGKRMSATDWAEAVGMNPSALHARIASGWSVADAITTPIQKRRPAPRCIFLEHAGRRLNISQWARELGVTDGMIRYRLATGWSVADTLTVPSGRAHASFRGVETEPDTNKRI